MARVLGAFPEGTLAVDAALAWHPATNHVAVAPGGPRVAPPPADLSAADLSAAPAPAPAVACAGTDAAGARAGAPQPKEAPGSAAAVPNGPRHGAGEAGAGADASGQEDAEGADLSTGKQREQPGVSSLVEQAPGQAASSSGAERGAVGSQGWQEPKAALTRFRRLALAGDERTSLVECR